MRAGPGLAAAMLCAGGLAGRLGARVRARRAANRVRARLGPPRARPGDTGALARLGALVLRGLLRQPAGGVIDPGTRRLAGVGVVVLLALPVAGPLSALPAGLLLGAAWRRARHPPGAADPAETLPDVLDLLGVAARAGLPVQAAVGAVAGRSPPPWGAALAAVDRRTQRGERFVDALDALDAVAVDRAHAAGDAGGTAGDDVRRLVTLLRNAVVDGGSLARDLAHLADDARELRRRRAEQTARRVPVRLLAPLVTCSLPAFALLTVVPAAVGALRALEL